MPNSFGSKKGRKLNVGMKVKVYFNLHNQLFSIKHNNCVVGYGEELYLKDVEFVVQKGGRKKVLETKQKNVHAFAVGTLFDPREREELDMYQHGEDVNYNPYRFSSFFVRETEKHISKAQMLRLFLDSSKKPRMWAMAAR